MKLSCAHLSGEWQFHAEFYELIGAFLVCLPDCMSTMSSTATLRTRSTAATLPDNTRLVDSLTQTVDASNFPAVVEKLTQRPLCMIML